MCHFLFAKDITELQGFLAVFKRRLPKCGIIISLETKFYKNWKHEFSEQGFVTKILLLEVESRTPYFKHTNLFHQTNPLSPE